MSLVARSNVFDFDRFFNDAWPQPTRAQAEKYFTPRVDISESQSQYEIFAELPGIAKEDISLQLEEGILTLEANSAKRDVSESDEENASKVIRQERRFGKYLRRFNLGTEVEEEAIKATFNNGVLHLEVPKRAEEVVEPRRIEVA